MMKYFVVMAICSSLSLSLLIPTPLVPLGHHPMICILIKSILECENDGTVVIIVKQDYETMFEREMKRWFPDKSIIILGTVSSSSSQALFSFVEKFPSVDVCYVTQSDFPLITQDAIEQFMHQTSNIPFAVMGINKTRWNKDRNLYNMELDSDRVTMIEKKPFESIGFLPFIKCPLIILKKHLLSTENYFEVIHECEKKPFLVKIHSCAIEIDSISVVSASDKTFAEHKYLEKEHAMYLTQCYSIWNCYKQLDERITRLENKSKK